MSRPDGPLVIDRALAVRLAVWNAANRAAARQYYAYPIISTPGCNPNSHGFGRGKKKKP